MARVIVGDAHYTRDTMQKANRAPDDPNTKKPKDSVVAYGKPEGGCVDFPEIITYKDGQALPLFVLSYSHKAGCKCAECRKRPD